jgi:hypothetical protein
LGYASIQPERSLGHIALARQLRFRSLNVPAEGGNPRYILADGAARSAERDRRSRIDAFQCHWIVTDVENLLVLKNAFNVLSSDDPSEGPRF